MDYANQSAKEAISRSSALAGSGSVGYGPVASEPVTQPIHAAVASLEKAHHALHDTITALTQRLELILAPLPPPPVGNDATRTPRHSLSLSIDAEANSALVACQRLSDLINRLEL